MNPLRELQKDYLGDRLMLFVGAGVSATLQLPSWSGLIDHMARELGYDPDLFRSFGSFPALAEFYRLTKGDVSDLVAWMKREWRVPSTILASSAVHQKIVRAGFPIIYTTNFDDLLERSYDILKKPVAKIVTGEDIPNITEGQPQIVKFHGDLDNPDSLVLTEGDYFERLRFESELDIKLRADLLRYSTLFIGYSLSDINIRAILHRLAIFRSRYALTGRHLYSYVYADRHNLIQEQILERWGVKTIFSTDLDKTKALEDFLDAALSTKK